MSFLEQARDDSAELVVWILPRRERSGSQGKRKASPEDFFEGITLLVATAKQGHAATAN